MKRRRGFTLIELLIVVAIILILIAIALPNFLAAQIRAKVTKVKAEMKLVATALEAYVGDFNWYINPFYPSFGPPVGSSVARRHGGGWLNMERSDGGETFQIGNQLTTPMRYLTDIPSDPFWESVLQDDYNITFSRCGFLYWGTREPNLEDPFGPPPWTVLPLRYVLQSPGPDLQQDGFQSGYNQGGTPEWPAPWYVYSPTNGVKSEGEILYYSQLGFLDDSH